MDTGLVANIPTYAIEEMSVRSESGTMLGQMALFASVSEDPAITLMPHAAPGAILSIVALDTNGRTYAAKVPVARQSASALAAQP